MRMYKAHIEVVYLQVVRCVGEQCRTTWQQCRGIGVYSISHGQNNKRGYGRNSEKRSPKIYKFDSASVVPIAVEACACCNCGYKMAEQHNDMLCVQYKSLAIEGRTRSDSHPLQAPTTISDPTCRPPHPKTNPSLNACTTPSPHSSPSNFASNANSNNNSTDIDIDIDSFPKSNNHPDTTLNTTPNTSTSSAMQKRVVAEIIAESCPPFDHQAAVVGPYEED